jgi:hypothetical protein
MFSFFFFYGGGGTGVWIQGFMLYHLSLSEQFLNAREKEGVFILYSLLYFLNIKPFKMLCKFINV